MTQFDDVQAIAATVREAEDRLLRRLATGLYLPTACPIVDSRGRPFWTAPPADLDGLARWLS